jgi:hypothetical protein
MLFVGPSFPVKAGPGEIKLWGSPRLPSYWHHLVLPRSLRGRLVRAEITPGILVVGTLPDWVERDGKPQQFFELADWRKLERVPSGFGPLRIGQQVVVTLDLVEASSFDAVFVWNELEPPRQCPMCGGATTGHEWSQDGGWTWECSQGCNP